MIVSKKQRDVSGTKSPLHSKHFPVLDGLRGVAALAVVAFHSFNGGGIFRHGGLAVDLFFLMSGFVIAHSYGDRLASRMTKADFLIRRFVRLYPMLFIGAVGGIALALAHKVISPADDHAISAILTSGALSVFALPYFGLSLSNNVFSFNPPIWSLFFEIVANIIFAFTARRLGVSVLATVVVAGLLGTILGGGLGGNEIANFAAGFPRVTCGFFGGLLLHRLWVKYPSFRIGASFPVLTVALLAILCIPAEVNGLIFLPIFCALAAIVWAAVGLGSAGKNKAMTLLGELSYPIYLIHYLTLYASTFIGEKLHLPYEVVAIGHLCLVPFIAYSVMLFYERPARKWLARSLMPNNRRLEPATNQPV